MKKLFNTGLLMISIMVFVQCSDFLEEKSDTRYVTPETVADNQALLDKNSNLLRSNSISGQISCDDTYVTDADYDNADYDADKRLYAWQPNLTARATGNDWESCFFRINICNTVLNNIEYYNISNAENIKGQALAIRASIYLEAAQIWCMAYDNTSAANNLGLPLRLDPDFNKPSVRSNLKQTYDQILNDLHSAVALLPDKQVSTIRASRMTTYAYLARTYLYMGDYQNALKYANNALMIDNTLLDYNFLNAGEDYPIKNMNEEVILPTSLGYSSMLSSSSAKIPAELYNSYGIDDLRRSVYFRTNNSGEILFKGNYSGSSLRMSHIGIDELYLIAAESAAQLNDVASAMTMLNALLIKRWKTGTFKPMPIGDKLMALEAIAKERRKELLFRSSRWADLKRYNRDGAEITLKRTINGRLYTLPPNDLRYAIAIPEDIIAKTGMQPNPR